MTALHALPVIYATYLGVAEALVEAVLGTGRVQESSARAVGLLDFHLRTAGWALDCVLSDLGDDPDATVESYLTLQQMKRAVTVAVLEIAGIATELAGGGAYARRGAVERMTRDLRAALYHPHPRRRRWSPPGGRAWASPSIPDRRGLTGRWTRQPRGQRITA